MAKHNCEDCKFRAKYDQNPGSFLGRLWRWHINWCPGWKKYMNFLESDERKSIASRYSLKKFMNDR